MTDATEIDIRTDMDFVNRQLEQADRLLAARLQRAMAAGDLEVRFEPVIDLVHQSVVRLGAEVHWPGAGPLITGSRIRRAAESAHMAGDLDRHVVGLVAEHTRVWRRAGVRVSVGVGLSMGTLVDRSAVAEIVRVLGSFDADPSTVTIEIAARTATELAHSLAAATTLRSGGCRISLAHPPDSVALVAHLDALRTDEVMLERQHLERLESDERARSVVRAAVAESRARALDVVADGVETTGQLRLLRQLGCRAGHGPFLSRPLRPDEVFGLLAAAPVPSG